MHITARHIIDYAWIGIAILWLITSVTAKRSVRSQSLASRLFELCLTIAAFFLIFNPSLAIGPLAWRVVPKSPVSSGLGAVLTVAGILFAVWARFILGRNWSANVTVKQDHQLIRTGPYALMRHPIYSGLSLALLGTAIAFGQLRDVIALILAVTAWRLKSLVEERFMMEQFGTEYVDYKRRVKALVPFVW